MRRLIQMAAVVSLSISLVQVVLACEASDDTDYPTTVERAKKLNKPLLLAFVGTDWSITSLKLDREVFDQPEFADNEKYDFLLCKLHFYQTQERSPEILSQNQQLAEKYRIEKFPTVVVLSPGGDEIGRLGYVEGGAEKFGAAVKKIVGK